jgi:hypothetical protein
MTLSICWRIISYMRCTTLLPDVMTAMAPDRSSLTFRIDS